MIAEQFLIRGIELVGFVLVILAIRRNAVSSRLRERDPMRMSVRDLTAWLVADRVGSGKHVLRNIKLVRLAGPLIDLRTRLLAQNRPDAWLRTFEQTVYALRSITERIDVYDQTKREMRGSERRAARRAIRADAAGLVTWIHDMRQAAGRPLPHEAERTPLGISPAGDGAPLAEPMRRRIAEITRSATDALRSLPRAT